jgi:glycosyltransferase involved in cell wall biosynthesis
MVHEPFIEMKRGPLRHVAIAVVHRLMTTVLMLSAHRVWVAIPASAWGSRLRPYSFGRKVCIDWLPIPSCVTAIREPQLPVREKYAAATQLVIGHFGSYGDDVSALLVERLPSIMGSGAGPALLLIGARSDSFRAYLVARHPEWSEKIHATGYLPPTELPRYLAACDLLLQPYPDGITSRRTSAMACLALGLPIVTTSGHLTETLWAESGAVALADVSDAQGFATTATRLLTNHETRARLGQQGQRVYHDNFSVDLVVDALTSRKRQRRASLASCA